MAYAVRCQIDPQARYTFQPERQLQMLVTMTREKFNSLDSAALIWACIEPTIQQIKAKSLEVKAQVSAQLTAGQQALLMFQILYGHTRFQLGQKPIGTAELYGLIPYLPGQSRIWSSLRSAMGYFKDDAMQHLLEKMESLYLEAEIQHNGTEWYSQWTDPESEFRVPIDQLDATFQEIMPSTIDRISNYIRDNPGEFIRFDD
jgi:hypothetical protein